MGVLIPGRPALSQLDSQGNFTTTPFEGKISRLGGKHVPPVEGNGTSSQERKFVQERRQTEFSRNRVNFFGDTRRSTR